MLFRRQTVKPERKILVGLLMVDEETRQFELLNQEYRASQEATVDHLLATAEVHASNKALASKAYTGVCTTADASVLSKSERLFDICQDDHQVLVAVPVGASAADVLAVARPILADDNVVPLLSPQGLNQVLQKQKKARQRNNKKIKASLLMVDGEDRKFELLALDLDPKKDPLVATALARIPTCVTNKKLKAKSYTGVCNTKGVVMPGSMPIFDFCSTEDQILIALPSDCSVEESLKLAKPILTDPKVLKLIAKAGISVGPWLETEEDAHPPTIV